MCRAAGPKPNSASSKLTRWAFTNSLVGGESDIFISPERGTCLAFFTLD